MICTMIYQLTKDASPKQMEEAGLGGNYAIRDNALFPTDANGVPWTAAYFQAHGDPVTDLTEDMAAEQKARAVYEHLLNMTDDPGMRDALQYLREREVVHFQRFGEALRIVQEYQDSKKFY